MDMTVLDYLFNSFCSISKVGVRVNIQFYLYVRMYATDMLNI